MTPEQKEQIRERLQSYSYCSSSDTGHDRLISQVIADIPALLAANDELEKELKTERLLVKGLEGNLKACEDELDRMDTLHLRSEKRVKDLEADLRYEYLDCGHSEQYAYSDNLGKTGFCLLCKITSLEKENAELGKAASGMLENYLFLKDTSLRLARGDAPNWIGSTLTPEDDIHVIAVRKALDSAAKEAK